MAMKYNPFQPNKIVAPGVFTGRVDELKTIEQCLFQAKNGNPQNFLLQGERGIGKSSLFLYIDCVAKGAIEPLSSKKKFNFLTASTDLAGCHDQIDIIRTVARAIKISLKEYSIAQEAIKSFLSWIANWEILGVRYHKEGREVDPQEILDELVTSLSNLFIQCQGELDGLLILLDESDQPEASANLGQFVKFFTERMTKKNCNNTLIGMAGLPSILIKLRESHESAPRLFETMHLEPLELEERKSVIRKGLKQAESKNDFETVITEDAINLIADLSEGYPHFVQQFAYSAFDHDSDNVIDVEDVLGGSYKENGAIAQLGRKYFNEMYFGKIASDDYRRVLVAMADSSDNWVAKKDIIERSNVKSSTVSNAIIALKAKNIILVDTSRQGFYRLPTKSFAAWIKAIKSVEKRQDGEPLLFANE